MDRKETGEHIALPVALVLVFLLVALVAPATGYFLALGLLDVMGIGQ